MIRLKEQLFIFFVWAAAALSVSVVLAAIGWVAIRGWGAMSLSLFFDDVPFLSAIVGEQRVWEGIWPALCGTVVLVFTTMLMAAPIGILSGIHLAIFSRGRAKRFSMGLVDTLAGVPSVIVGLFGFAWLLFLRESLMSQATSCLLLASSSLAVLVLPYLIKLTVCAIEVVPSSSLINGDALGMTEWQKVWHLIIPQAKRGIGEGVVLAFCRASEDTAVILFTGVVANAGLPKGLFDKFEALPFYIYSQAMEGNGSEGIRAAFGAAFVLIVVTCFTASLVRRFGCGRLCER